MLKKHLISVMLMVIAIASANAGTWKLHNYYVTDRIQNVIDAGNKVYYQNSGRLYEFDKATSTTVALGRQNILSDNLISNIYYDWENKLLFIAYSNSNIDVIDEAGTVTNISSIKDIVSQVRNYSLKDGELESYADKSILDITFADGIAYVSIGYGYATIDESTLKITKFYDLGSNITVNSVCSFNGKILIVANVNCYYGDPGEEDPIKNYQKIPNPSGSSTTFFRGVNTYPIDDHSIFMLSTAQSKLYNFDFSSGTPVLTDVVSAAPTCVQKTTTGFIANFAGQKYYYTIDPTGKIATKVGTTVGFASSDPNGDGTVWINDANGIHISGTSTNYKMNSLTMTMPHWLKYNAAMDKLYVATPGPNAYDALGQIYLNVINTYNGSLWSTANAYSGNNTVGYDFVFDPKDPYTYVRTSWAAGIYKVTRDVLKTTYKSSNSLIGNYKPHPAFDNYGNMWVVSSYGSASCPAAVLPRANYEKTTTPAKTDWFQPSGLLSLSTGSTQRSRFLVAKKNNVKIYSDCDFPTTKSGMIYCWDNDNEDPTVDTYRLSSITHFTDQNNRQIDWTYLIHMEEDNDGMIWVGHVAGLFVFDPAVVFDELPKATRPFASKFSEGKGFLCEGYSVYDIGVDRDNNKWLASNNGVYFVSPDGSEVFNHFTTDNSDIPSNLVYSVECDTINNRIYIYTDNGFAEYVASGDAASLNFDNVYTFPNPVEPDFTGMVKIANLMDNSYVTITDREGNIMKQLGPVMGSALWDASGTNGERVPTGIYNVYAAQGAQPAITGTPHATIMVIK